MTDSSNVVDRVDSFMRPDGNPSSGIPRSGRRRRSFLASPRASEDDFPDTRPLAEEEDDLPVLTEIVPSQEDEQELAPQTGPRELDEEEVAHLAADIVEAVGKQLAYELPTLLEATLLNASEELRAGIASTMDSALRDYLARRKQLSLPLEEPDAIDRN